MKFLPQLGLLLLLCNPIKAQSLILGVPSASIAERNSFEVTHESQVNAWDKEKVQWHSFNFVCYGLTKNIELTASFNNLNNLNDNHLASGIGFKVVKRIAKTTDLSIVKPKIIVGSNAVIGLAKPSLGAWAYTMGSIRLPNFNTRLTGGLSYGTEEMYGYRDRFDETTQTTYNQPIRTAAFCGGVEQPVTEDITLLADYYAGEHDLAALIMAVQYETENNVFILGYKKPNETQETDALVIEVMHRF